MQHWADIWVNQNENFPKLTGQDKIEMKTTFPGLPYLNHGHAKGVKEHVMDGFKNLSRFYQRFFTNIFFLLYHVI